MLTGFKTLNKLLGNGTIPMSMINQKPTLEGVGQDMHPSVLEVQFQSLKRRTYYRSTIHRGLGVLIIGCDVITERPVALAKKTIGQSVNGKLQDGEVFVVHDLYSPPETGLFFITRTLAECHLINITGKPSEQDIETGGRTLRELTEYLFER